MKCFASLAMTDRELAQLFLRVALVRRIIFVMGQSRSGISEGDALGEETPDAGADEVARAHDQPRSALTAGPRRQDRRKADTPDSPYQ